MVRERRGEARTGLDADRVRYAWAEERLGRTLKVPKHDVAHQFLEHATAVNEFYVALARKPPKAEAQKPGARRGKPADDFACVPTDFRWVPSEDLELPFEEYVRQEARTRDRRLQPDAMIEDSSRRRRYLIEYETGTASVRNAQHKTATLTKLNRYLNFFYDFVPGDFRKTYYARPFVDGFVPVLLFVTRTTARRDTIREAVTEWAAVEERRMRIEVRALTMTDASAEFRSSLLGERPPAQGVAPARPPPLPSEGAFVAWRDLELLRYFQEEALQTIQHVRHTVRAGRPVASEPRYPETMLAAARLLQRLLEAKPVKPR